MARVYVADDLKHERKVALKVLKPELAAVVGAERFLAEIKVTANLQHPHILPLHDSEALDYAHQQGVIHRDIKPANILMQAGKPVISDFGIALALGVAGGGRLTETGLSVGTPHYMSPEQATGDQTVGAATDIYALGAVLYEMLVGDPPYMGSTAQAILGKIIQGKVASATEERASVPANVDAAIRKALEKLPADRFTGAQEFAGALADPGFHYGEVDVAAVAARAGPWNWLTVGFAGLAAVFGVVATWSLLGPEPPAPVARFASPFEEGQFPGPVSYGMDFMANGSALVYVGPGPPYVEGETLRDRIDREKQLPVDEAVALASKVAGALQHAHAHGVIHRDIKPGNILLQGGEPVVSDFGIALAVGAAGSNRLTETGLSLGTPFYMSPEQATGDQAVGASTDTYALGSVLYEMLTGDPPYMGSTAQAVLGQIIAGKPVSATEHRPSIPANVDAAVRKALEKLPADRFTSAQDFVRALGDEHFRYGELATGVAGDFVPGIWRQLATGLAVLATALAVMLGWSLLRPAPPAPLARFSAPFEEGQAPAGFGFMDFTPGGEELVYVGPDESGQGTQLWIRRWADLDATPIRGTEGAGFFTLSPDGREVAFASPAGPLRVAPLAGGPSRTLAEAAIGVSDWSSDGNVYFTEFSSLALSRTPASGGGTEAVESVTELREGEVAHNALTVLPGERMGLFFLAVGVEPEVWAIDLDTGEREFLIAGLTPRFASTGHLLFGTPEGVLMAAPIDPATAELTGPAVPVAEELAIDPPSGVSYAVSQSGTLIYRAGGVAVAEQGTLRALWVTRSGDEEPVDPSWRFNFPFPDLGLRLSPDGARLALSTSVDGNVDIWVKQLPDGPLERLTFDDEVETDPFWSTDGRFVTYVKNESGNYDVWRRHADGAGTPELLLDDERSLHQVLWSPDGEWMVFRTGGAGFGGRSGDSDIVGFRPGVDSAVTPLVATTDFAEQDPALSPDGRWLAYTSDETGRNEVYVTPFPNVESARVQVSIEGGFSPQWAHSGSELFFADALGGSLIAAEVETASGFRVLQRETLFALGAQRLVLPGLDSYDVMPDDQRFLMVSGAPTSSGDDGVGRFILVQNFFEELRERVPN